MEIHGVYRPVVRRRGVGREIELDVLETHVLEPTVGMPENQARALAMGDDIAQNNMSDRARRGLVGFQRQSKTLAASLHGEVDWIAIAPPEPIKTVGVDD